MKFRKIYIEITNACNLTCSFCSKSKRTIHSMSLVEFEKVIREIFPYTNVVYLHVKGEPFVHPQFDEILSICDAYNMRVNITTNGTLLKNKVGILKKHHCIKKMNISLHCEHNGYPNYYKDVFDAVEKLPHVYIMYRIWTLQEYELNAQAIEIISALKEYYHIDYDLIQEIKTKNHIQMNERLYLDKENEFIWPDLNNEILQERGYCYALKTHIAVLSDGTVIPCCLDGEGILALGNIFEENLEDILHSPRAKAIKKSFQDRILKEELCKKCGFIQRLKK